APLFVSWSTWWFRDSLAYLKLSFGSSIDKVWKLVDTLYQAMWDTTYWGFLGAQIRHIFLDGYGVLRIDVAKLEMMDKKGSREWQLVDLEKEAKERALKIDWSMIKDYRLASEINRMAGEVNNVVVVKDQFLEELDSLGVRPVPVKLAEFLREIQMRDKETVAKLHILEREMELNARKKNLFIQKLKGVILY
ncbi:hypothetical protein Tco_0375437, partial [Tanacetum coccineum]